MSLNVFVCSGRLSTDVEPVRAANGKNCVRFNVAVERNYKSPNGERETDFFSCIASGHTADFIQRYFVKGSPVVLHGEGRINSYTDKQGIKRSSFTVSVQEAHFAGPKPGTSTPQAGQQVNAAPDDFSEIDGFDSDDCPF